jgi:hypothetical protein
MRKPNISKPTPEIIKSYLKKWETLENYVLQEKSLWILFHEAYPENKKIEHILIKVSCLNDFYSTNIFSPYIIAKHILGLDVDKYLAMGNVDVVNKIAKVKMPGGRIINFYSFASKYCSHHRPERYPIYDSYVEKMLIYFRKREKFYRFNKEDLHNYRKFIEILGHFKKFFGLYEYSLRDIDKYLWQAGKKYFPRKY